MKKIIRIMTLGGAIPAVLLQFSAANFNQTPADEIENMPEVSTLKQAIPDNALFQNLFTAIADLKAVERRAGELKQAADSANKRLLSHKGHNAIGNNIDYLCESSPKLIASLNTVELIAESVIGKLLNSQQAELEQKIQDARQATTVLNARLNALNAYIAEINRQIEDHEKMDQLARDVDTALAL